MDSGTIIIAILFILVCSIPFIIMGRNNKKREKQFLKKLVEIADKNNCKLSNHDFLPHAAIATDYGINIIFFIKKVNNIETQQLIKLTEIKNCQLINTTRTGNNEDGTFKIINRLELMLEYCNKSKEDSILEFYNANYSSPTLTRELQLAEKWCKIINVKVVASTSRKKMIA